MGGGGMFDALICLRCEREFVAVYPTRHVGASNVQCCQFIL